MLTEERKSQIIAEILKKNPTIECPMCHHRHFALLDGYITDNIQNDYKSIIIGGGTILPLATIICKNCGFIAQYSLGALGLFDEKELIDTTNQESLSLQKTDDKETKG